MSELTERQLGQKLKREAMDEAAYAAALPHLRAARAAYQAAFSGVPSSIPDDGKLDRDLAALDDMEQIAVNLADGARSVQEIARRAKSRIETLSREIDHCRARAEVAERACARVRAETLEEAAGIAYRIATEQRAMGNKQAAIVAEVIGSQIRSLTTGSAAGQGEGGQ